MKQLALFSFTFLSLLLVAGPSLTAQEKYTLKKGYAPGQYDRVTEVISVSTSTISGHPFTSKETQMQYVTVDAAEKNADDTQNVTAEITRMTSSANGGNVHDSANVNDSEALWFGLFIGLKVTTLYDQDSHPIKSEGGEEHFKKLMADPKYTSPDYIKEMVKGKKLGMTDFESGQITADLQGEPFDLSRIKMPKTPVAVGETWKTEYYWQTYYGQTMDEEYKIKVHKFQVENTLTEVKTENDRKIAIIVSKTEGSAKGVVCAAAIVNQDFRVETITWLDIESHLILKSISNMESEKEMVAPFKQKSSHKIKTTVTQTPKQ